MLRWICFLLAIFLLTSCASTQPKSAPAAKQPKLGLADTAYLEQGKRYFEAGFYKRAMQALMPVAADGSVEAQYAVGFMYYYGYGVSQDTNVGYFWIQRAAAQHYVPAIRALRTIDSKRHRATFSSSR